MVNDVGRSMAVFLKKLNKHRLLKPVAGGVQKQRVGASGVGIVLVPHPVAECHRRFGEPDKQNGSGEMGGNLLGECGVYLGHHAGSHGDVATKHL